MNHRPFEKLILNDAELSLSDRRTLGDHLDDCPTCRQLAEAWCDVEGVLRDSPLVSPMKGFSQRWQNRLAVECLRRQRRQTLFTLLFCIGGALLLFLLLGLLLFPLLKSPIPVLMVLAYQIATWYSAAQIGLGFVATFLGTFIGVIPGTFWVGVGAAVCALGALWVVAFHRLTSSRRFLL